MLETSYDRPAHLIVDPEFNILVCNNIIGVLPEKSFTGMNLPEVFKGMQPAVNAWPKCAIEGPFFAKAVVLDDGLKESYPVNLMVVPQTQEEGYLVYIRSDVSGLELIGESYFELDRNTLIRHLNKAAEKLFHIKRSEIINKCLFEVFPTLEKEFAPVVQKVIRKAVAEEIEILFLPLDAYFRFRLFPIAHGVRVFVYDISRYRYQEKRLQEQSILLKAVLDNVMAGVITINTDGKIQTFNEFAEKLTGYSADEVIGQNVAILMANEHARNHNQYIHDHEKNLNLVKINMRRNISIRKKNGHYFPAEIIVSEAKILGEIVYISSFQDVTEKLQREKEIYSIARFPDEDPSPVMRIDSNGSLTYANAASRPLLSNWNITLGGIVQDDLREIILNVFIGQVSESVEIKINDTYYSLLIAPVANESYVNVYGSDITQRVNDETELLMHRTRLEDRVAERTAQLAEAKDEALQANRAKSAFLANMSHELRTPLNAVIGYSEILMENAVEFNREEEISDLQKIHKSGQHLLNLINDILDLSKIEAGRMELNNSRFILGNTLQSIVETVFPVMEKNRNQFRSEIPNYDIVINADETRLRQVLLNLLSNAAKFTVDGLVSLIVETDTNWVYMKVIDSGIGIGDQQMQQLFTPFSQGSSDISIKYGGTGLGLAISQQFCQLMGGKITASSKIGEGSEFVIKLPLLA